MPLSTEKAPNCLTFLRVLETTRVPVGILYLAFGHTFSVQPPWKKPTALMGECYKNAGNLALEDDTLVYCEGWAYKPGIIPLHHAWCVDPNGEVIDPTWGTGEGHEYLGIGLARDFYFDFIQSSGVWGVLADGWPKALLELRPEVFLDPQWRPEPERLDNGVRFLLSQGLRPNQR